MCPLIYGWIRKIQCLHTMDYHFVVKKDKFESCIGNWMNLETLILSEIKQTHELKYHTF